MLPGLGPLYGDWTHGAGNGYVANIMRKMIKMLRD